MSIPGPKGKPGRMGPIGPTGPAGPAGSGSISNGNSIIIPTSNIPPSSPVTGMIYCDTKVIPASLQFYNGLQWINISNLSSTSSTSAPSAPSAPTAPSDPKYVNK